MKDLNSLGCFNGFLVGLVRLILTSSSSMYIRLSFIYSKCKRKSGVLKLPSSKSSEPDV